jgi:hypothetical protein
MDCVDYLTKRRKSSDSLKQSFRKEFSYISIFLKNNVIVENRFEKIILTPPRKVVISPSLFERSYSCLDYPGCKVCCHAFYGVFLDGAVRESPHYKLISSFKTESVIFNGKEMNYYVENHEKGVCSLNSDGRGCVVHEVNPITCLFPLVMFRKVGANISVQITSYGRNWALGCPIKFKPSNADYFNESVLPRFKRLNHYMNELGVEHTCSEFIHRLEREAHKFYHGGFNLQ